MALAVYGVLCFGFGCRWTAKGPVSYFHVTCFVFWPALEGLNLRWARSLAMDRKAGMLLSES